LAAISPAQRNARERNDIVRLPELDPAVLSERQTEVHRKIGASHGGHVRGPWAVALRVPEVAYHTHALYERLCRDTKLGKRLFELMVLVVARHWTSQFEWHTHEKYAREAGISDAVIEAIRARQTPLFGREDEQLVYDVVSELSETKALSPDTYERAQNSFGDALLVELVSAAGLYTMVAMMLNAFDVPIPDGARRLT
jgi:4-carboxymuconolactone decarboxylase